MVTVLDKDFNLVFANKSFLDWSGYTKSDIIGTNLGDYPFYPDNPAITVKEHLKNGLLHFSIFGLIPTPNHGFTPVQAKWTGRFDTENNLTGYTGYAFCLEKLNHGAPVSYTTRNGRILAATKSLPKLGGYTLEEFIGQTAHNYYFNLSDREKLFKSLEGSAVGEWTSIAGKTKNGELINVEMRLGKYEHIYRMEIRKEGSGKESAKDLTPILPPEPVSLSYNGDGLITQTIDTKFTPLPHLCKRCRVTDCNRTPHWKTDCKQYQTFEVLPYTVATFDKDFRFKYINKAFLNWSGYDRSDIEGKGVDDFEFYPQNPTAVLKKHVKAGGTLFSWFGFAPVPKFGLTPLQAQWSCRFDAQGRLSGYTCMSFSLEELNNGAAVSYVTCNRKILTTTRKYQEIVGRTPVETISTATFDPKDAYVNPADRDRLFSRIPQQGGAVGDWLKTALKRPDGTVAPVRIRGGRYEHINRFEIRTK